MSAFFISGCATPETFENAKRRKNAAEAPVVYEKIFLVPVESVWKAAQKTLKYSIAVDNMEHGVLETEWIRGEDAFLPAHLTESPSSGVKTKISLKVIKGKLKQKESIRVVVTKLIERQRDFFAPGEDLASDGIEEKMILYRIEREVLIEEALKKGTLKAPSRRG